MSRPIRKFHTDAASTARHATIGHWSVPKTRKRNDRRARAERERLRKLEGG